MTLADRIEAYLKECLGAEPHGTLEIQRRWIATHFACAPSQINYVLTTRFSCKQGYRVESRRGGGGFLRISRARIMEEILARLEHEDDNLSQDGTQRLLARLTEEGLLTRREGALLSAALKPLDRIMVDGTLRMTVVRAVLGAITAHP